jgi:hypothetical protein
MSFFIEREIKHEWITLAEARSIEMGAVNNSFMKGKGNKVGFIGEYVVLDYLKERNKESDVSLVDKFDYDILFNDMKIDVKSKSIAVEPKSFYEASIADTSLHQDCDTYIFVGIHKSFETAYVYGWEYKEDYFNKARHMKKGDVDKKNNYTCPADCYNLKYGDLRGF